ncbi:MAG: glycosyltransferase [Actinomycetota bacterium]
MYLSGDTRAFRPTLQSLAEHVGGHVVLGGPGADAMDLPHHLYTAVLPGTTPASLVEAVWAQHRCDVLLVSDAVLVPPGLLEGVHEIEDMDIRAATVSFLSNAAAFLSFPWPGVPTDAPPGGHDEVSVTRLLRSTPPTPGPVPVPMAEGGCVVLTAAGLSLVRPVDGPDGTVAQMVRDFSLNARRRGFLSFLDAQTFVARSSDLSVFPSPAMLSAGVVDDWLATRHPFLRELLAAETAVGSPLDIALHAARGKVEGLRVVIDGACLGPHEMGTQVATLSLVRSLAERNDVEEVRVVVDHHIPAYAREPLSNPKISVVHRSALAALPPGDIAHRPYQPEPLFSVAEWRPAARRLLVGMLDLIAYQIGSYHRSPQEWLRYRSSIRSVLSSADGVVVNSQDVRLHIELEALPVDPSRLWVVPLGMDHLSGGEEARMPAELASRGFAHQEFVLTLGANYSHKNRDLAIRAHRELRRRRPELVLVLAGARVPHGSSRLNESGYRSEDGVFDLPGVTSEERNWLFRHASVALYPTSAEGFGLVPVEVARFGTPIVYVGFGPLREISGDPPVAAVDWDPRSLAAAVEALMGDPELARGQVAATLAAGEKYTWARTAADLVAVYREVLARPAAGGNYDGPQVEGRTHE